MNENNDWKITVSKEKTSTPYVIVEPLVFFRQNENASIYSTYALFKRKFEAFERRKLRISATMTFHFDQPTDSLFMFIEHDGLFHKGTVRGKFRPQSSLNVRKMRTFAGN